MHPMHTILSTKLHSLNTYEFAEGFITSDDHLFRFLRKTKRLLFIGNHILLATVS